MAVAFSDTTNKNGLIQMCELYTHLGDTTISGDTTTLLKQFTFLLNNAYDEVLPLVFAADGRWQWEDFNHTTLPIATTNIVSGQRDYGFTTDSAGASVLRIDKVAIKQDATTSDYTIIHQIDQNDGTGAAKRLIEDNSDNTGIPTGYDLVGGSIILNPEPDYAATSGLKIWYSRTPDYFSSTDTTQTPGIPDMFHSLLALIASHEWMFSQDPTETTTISRLEQKIAEKKMELSKFINLRPQKAQMVRSVRRSPA